MIYFEGYSPPTPLTTKSLRILKNPSMVFALPNLKACFPNADKVTLFKLPREGRHADACISKLSFGEKTYGLKKYPDVWINSMNIYRKKWINKINDLECTNKVVTSFLAPSCRSEVSDRYVLFEFHEGRPLSWEDATKPENALQIASIIKKLANIHISAGSAEIDNFIITPQGKVLLVDWDSLRVVEKAVKPKNIYLAGTVYMTNASPNHSKITFPKYEEIDI